MHDNSARGVGAGMLAPEPVRAAMMMRGQIPASAR